MPLFRFFFGMLFSSSLLQAAPFYKEHAQGWFWYRSEVRDQKADVSAKDEKDHLPSLKRFQKVLSARERVKRIQENFEEATARAVLNPTLANVRDVMRLQRVLIERSTVFQERWMHASLLEAGYRKPDDNPAPLHRKLMREEQEKERDRKIRRIAKETGLFFLFKEKCSYCHAFAPHVKEFATTYGFEVKAISGDGGKLQEFPEALSDNGIMQKINGRGIYPALFLAHPPTGKVIPLAWGLTTPEQLRENMALIIKALERKDF